MQTKIIDDDRNCAFSLVMSEQGSAEKASRVTINVHEFAHASDYTIDVAACDVPGVIDALTNALAHARQISLASEVP
jgi:hypothetical protein